MNKYKISYKKPSKVVLCEIVEAESLLDLVKQTNKILTNNSIKQPIYLDELIKIEELNNE